MEPTVAVILASVLPVNITGRAWKLTTSVSFQVEVQDRSLAWTDPHSGGISGSRRRTLITNIIVTRLSNTMT